MCMAARERPMCWCDRLTQRTTGGMAQKKKAKGKAVAEPEELSESDQDDYDVRRPQDREAGECG